MEINRALKRIRKKENIFFIIMGILSVLIPTLAYLANLKNTFVYVYIAIIEFLILIAILARIPCAGKITFPKQLERKPLRSLQHRVTQKR